jgi:hypothetical protein
MLSGQFQAPADLLFGKQPLARIGFGGWLGFGAGVNSALVKNWAHLHEASIQTAIPTELSGSIHIRKWLDMVLGRASLLLGVRVTVRAI